MAENMIEKANRISKNNKQATVPANLSRKFQIAERKEKPREKRRVYPENPFFVRFSSFSPSSRG